jgi:hypothetical protein
VTRARSIPTGVSTAGRAQIPARTLRTDRWWQAPLTTAGLLSLWVLYAVLRTASQRAYFVPKYHYLSPFTSPCVTASCPQAARDFGTWFGHFPPFIPLAIIVLPFLLGFRLTCYYYRRAYYRAFWQSPPACGVAEPHGKYTGETRFPLIVQNLHRYFFYAALLISLINTWDLIRAFRGPNDSFGFGLGTVIMLVNVALPFMPSHRRRPAAQLLASPAALPRLGDRVEAQRQAHAACVGHTRHPDADRRVHRVGCLRCVQRPTRHQLIDRSELPP